MAVDPLTETQGNTEASTPAPPRTQTTSTCSNCGSNQQNPPTQTGPHSRNFIYAIGRIESRFPSISVEKEFAQALGRVGTAGKTDREAFYKVLSDPDNLYLARQLCWVMRISDVDTYIVLPKNPADIGLLIQTLRASSEIGALDAVIGIRGPMAPPATV